MPAREADAPKYPRAEACGRRRRFYAHRPAARGPADSPVIPGAGSLPKSVLIQGSLLRAPDCAFSIMPAGAWWLKGSMVYLSMQQNTLGKDSVSMESGCA